MAEDSNEAGGSNSLRWTDLMSSCMLKRMSELVRDGVRADKGFKMVHLNLVAKHIEDSVGVKVSGAQISNHLRKWRARWQAITKLKGLSGALWQEEGKIISLAPSHYAGHIKDHPKDAPFLNKPLEFYEELAIIFGGTLATGVYARGINDGPLDDTVEVGEIGESIPNNEGVDGDAAQQRFSEAPVTESSVGRRRKRNNEDEDGLLVHHMVSGLREIASAIREAIPGYVTPDLLDRVLELPGFAEADLQSVYDYLILNNAEANGFLSRTVDQRVAWVRRRLERGFFELP